MLASAATGPRRVRFSHGAVVQKPRFASELSFDPNSTRPLLNRDRAGPLPPRGAHPSGTQECGGKSRRDRGEDLFHEIKEDLLWRVQPQSPEWWAVLSIGWHEVEARPKTGDFPAD